MVVSHSMNLLGLFYLKIYLEYRKNCSTKKPFLAQRKLLQGTISPFKKVRRNSASILLAEREVEHSSLRYTSLIRLSASGKNREHSARLHSSLYHIFFQSQEKKNKCLSIYFSFCSFVESINLI